MINAECYAFRMMYMLNITQYHKSQSIDIKLPKNDN